MPTGVVRPGSDLERRRWMREGMVQAASKSFWNGMTGTTMDSVVMVAKNKNAKDGHTVVFDFDGNLSGKAVKGKETAFGKGEQKRKFSDKVTVERYRLPVDNGDAFDGVNIGDLSITQHSDSRTKLSDLWVRWKDQAIFDAAQGNLITLNDQRQTATHVIEEASGASFSYDNLVDIERTLRTSQGFTTGGIRRPLKPFNVNDSDPVWLVILDASTTALLRKDTRWTNIMSQSDVRGSGNRLITGQIKRLGALMVMEAPTFFGETSAGTSATGFSLNDSEVEISGLRQWDKQNNAWTGQEGFSYSSNNLWSRNLILGAGGIQLAFGREPDYRFQESEDFGIKSESALEVWCEARKTRLKQESGRDYNQAKVKDIDYGVVALDVKISS